MGPRATEERSEKPHQNNQSCFHLYAEHRNSAAGGRWATNVNRTVVPPSAGVNGSPRMVIQYTHALINLVEFVV
jgi:hypothetical protein